MFNDDNTLGDPKTHEYKNYFTNTYDLSKRFKKLNNKTSFGLDNIPNIYSIKTSQKLIYNYTIIFNNLLNYLWFPCKWKTAEEVVAVLKKDKDKTAQRVIDQ